ncbi:MAG: hypothetical protein IAF38_15110, partial [Bacteroidia bacterium]|nr:hypothetical protein [Bacteroidia bacterium]
MKKTLSIFLFFLAGWNFGQTYTIQRSNWQDAGYKGSKPVFSQTANIMNFGGNNSGTVSNNAALSVAISSLSGSAGTIYFPAGTFLFTASLNINRDSLVFKGAGHDSTTIVFNLGGVLNNCISILGSNVNADTTIFIQSALRDSNKVNCFNPANFQANDWVYLTCNDSLIMNDNWAYGSLGQIIQIQSVNANTLTFKSPFRYNYSLSLKPKIKKIIPHHDIGFECLKFKRMDATTGQTSIIDFDRAVNCWVNGIESDSSNFGHIELNRCSNIEITNSFFHHAHAYGGGGKAYGIIFQFSSGECKAEGNIFMHLRHGLLFQAGSNGNVCAYNYCFDPYWNEGFFPTNSAGELVLHGNFPFANLFEGNICNNIVIDDSHKNNGPYNTFFRNRAMLYGIYMNNNPATDSVQFLGNEVTNVASGFYNLAGNGHLQYGNNIKGTITPSGTTNLIDSSLYLTGGTKPLCMNAYSLPAIGMPNVYTIGSNEAFDRYAAGITAQCSCSNIVTSLNEKTEENSSVKIYPNPSSGKLFISEEHGRLQEAFIFDLNGKLLKRIKLSGKNTETDV